MFQQYEQPQEQKSPVSPSTTNMQLPSESMPQPTQQDPNQFDQQSVIDALGYAANLKGMDQESRVKAWPEMANHLVQANPQLKGVLDPSKPPSDEELDMVLAPIQKQDNPEDVAAFKKASTASADGSSGGVMDMFNSLKVDKKKGALPGGLQKSTRGALEQKIVGDQEQLGQIRNVYDTWDDNMFTTKGRISGTVAEYKDKLGVSNEGDKQLLDTQTKGKMAINQLFNAYRKVITGAAASDSEIQRLEKAYLNVNLSPQQARTARDEITKNIIKTMEVHKYMLENGVIPGSNDPEMKKAYQSRFSSAEREWEVLSKKYIADFKKEHKGATDVDALRYRSIIQNKETQRELQQQSNQEEQQ